MESSPKTTAAHNKVAKRARFLLKAQKADSFMGKGLAGN